MDPIYIGISIFLAVLVLLGIKFMSSPETAVLGNRLSAFSMFAAIILVLWSNEILTVPMIWIGVAVGSLLGYLLAMKATMIQMPQIVALLNGLGGGASALVAAAEIIDKYGSMDLVGKISSQLGLVVGGITLSGSLIAAAKLDRRMTQRPIIFKGHGLIANGSIVLMIAFAAATLQPSAPVLSLSLFILILSLFYGYLFAVRVGGADMPITISLLNAFSGLAGGIVGFTINEPLLVSVGAIVGASGLILTQIMCKAMNRSLSHVLSGATAKPSDSVTKKSQPALQTTAEPAPVVGETAVEQKPTAGQLLRTAKSVIIIPGYGMAIAQAQGQVKALLDTLVAAGTDVRFAIHPVAGRMPGHMNVLLAEVDVPYDLMCEMDDINPAFPETDVAIIVGSCDVVNPAAKTATDTPIYGMPILNVDQAKQVIVCNLDTNPGYSGVDNPLYEMSHVELLLGDAKESLTQLLQEFNAETTDVTTSPGGQVVADGSNVLVEVMQAAKKVIIVPGYGMAIAQAQGHVKQLADVLEARGVEVKFAIHPVAGRMPGHMNVLLAEVDVPYDKLCEMDDINPEFPETDVAIIVGSCDVVNPAAKTATDTPIYGMPILNVDQAKQVIVCNLDTNPGYSGVDNPLYEMTHVHLLLGDAKDSLTQVLAAVTSEAIAPATTSPQQPTDQVDSSRRELADARKVIMVPGYGMAIAQAQGLVKQLMDVLEAKGVAVDFAIHPVAGRMPGHMNVLLAEVDVPYDKLCEMDDINPKFPDTDVAIIVGACDVVNPAANNDVDTSIYGMPILNVDQAKHVVVCNLDTNPGYSGVANPLYEMAHVRLLLGDAKASLTQLIQEAGA